MTNLLITSKHVRLNVPIPPNSMIAVTDAYFENQSYNIWNESIEIMLYIAPRQISAITKRYTRIGHWYSMHLWLTKGHYSNLKTFQKECLSASDRQKTVVERKVLYHLFSRFGSKSGCLFVRPNFENTIEGTYSFKIKFPSKVAEYLGLHSSILFINSLGIADIDDSINLSYGIIMRPYDGPQHKLINFEARPNFTVLCDEVDTALAHSKEICSIFVNKPSFLKEYVQPRNVTFHKLTNVDHCTLTFNWPESIKLIFFNLSIMTRP